MDGFCWLSQSISGVSSDRGTQPCSMWPENGLEGWRCRARFAMKPPAPVYPAGSRSRSSAG